MLLNNVKLVVWDLDDTFWKGTLAEGPVEIPQENCVILETLAKRGIVSSISSKNNFENARKFLEENRLWFYFVFPQIQFGSKGPSIAKLIEHMNLRPDNVLFIDDNRLNLEEALYYTPNLMTAHPNDILHRILDLPQTNGKNDADLSRLRQYKQLETKLHDQEIASGSNEDFLRKCNIVVELDVDVEKYLDRVIELVNRSNQLNFTKKRIETDETLKMFKERLSSYGYHAGVVKVTDKYGDYGIVGFYMTERFANRYRLDHFVFSCRIMNMGIERYVYEQLGRPKIDVVEPVANGLEGFALVDWINRLDTEADSVAIASDSKLLLIGGCDLLQVATYCSTNRSEFVNSVNRGVRVRYDDPGFVLSSRDKVAASDVLPRLPSWTKDDVRRFDGVLNEAKTIIVSLWEAMTGDYLVIDGHILIRVEPGDLGKHLGGVDDKRCRFVSFDIEQKLELIRRSLDRIESLSVSENLYLLSAPTRGSRGDSLLRKQYNAMAEDYCREVPAFEFVSIDEVIPESEIVDVQHFTRKGYFALAIDLNRRMSTRSRQFRRHAGASSRACVEAGFEDILENARTAARVDGALSPIFNGT